MKKWLEISGLFLVVEEWSVFIFLKDSKVTSAFIEPMFSSDSWVFVGEGDNSMDEGEKILEEFENSEQQWVLKVLEFGRAEDWELLYWVWELSLFWKESMFGWNHSSKQGNVTIWLGSCMLGPAKLHIDMTLFADDL